MTWSIYTGWMPWAYAEEAGILKKWADRKGIEINLKRLDYIPSIEAYVAGKADACTMTNMEALSLPAAASISSTVLLLGDYSNGNDAILARKGLKVHDLKGGKKVSLSQFTVSHYLLTRGLELNGLDEKDVSLVNVGDADIASVFASQEKEEVVVCWNPAVLTLLEEPGIEVIFSSKDIPGEIQDYLVVNTEVLGQNPAFGEALTGAWYEVMEILSISGSKRDSAIAFMADLSGCSVRLFEQQLETTFLFVNPQAAMRYLTSQDLKVKMDLVRQFCFEHHLLGINSKSADEIGIQFPDGSVLGDSMNIQISYDISFIGYIDSDSPVSSIK